jgi:hypothetical protein
MSCAGPDGEALDRQHRIMKLLRGGNHFGPVSQVLCRPEDGQEKQVLDLGYGSIILLVTQSSFFLSYYQMWNGALVCFQLLMISTAVDNLLWQASRNG